MTPLKTGLVIFLLVSFSSAAAIAAEKKVMSVQVKEGHVRSHPSFLGKIVFKISYGEQVEKLTEKGDWVEVKSGGRNLEGWMHISALSQKKIILKPGAADVELSATSDEIALAGKGFNAQVEKEFQSAHRNLDFTWIDKMEQIVVSHKQKEKFLIDGNVYPEGNPQ